jgi:hypothetical protein
MCDATWLLRAVKKIRIFDTVTQATLALCLTYHRKNNAISIRNTEVMLTSGQNIAESVLDDDTILLTKQAVKFQSPT